MKIKTQSITESDFSSFGRIVTGPAGVPTAEDHTFRFWSDIASYHIDGETEIGLCTVFRQDPTVIDGMERHLNTPEILIPVDAPFILPLLSDGEPGENTQAFTVGIGQAVVVDPGIWHGACLPVGQDQSTYFVIFRRGTPHHDVEKKTIEPVEIISG